jgi:hypothetical protein
MATILIAIAAISVFHMLYERAIAPTLRMSLRHRLFSLRDEVRAMQATGVAAEDEEALWYVHEGINHFLDRLQCLSIQSRFLAERAYQTEAVLRARVDSRIAQMTRCKDPNVQRVFRDASRIVRMAFVVNMGGWLIYLVPLLVLVFTVGKLTKVASFLILAPGPDALRFLPARNGAGAKVAA